MNSPMSMLSMQVIRYEKDNTKIKARFVSVALLVVGLLISGCSGTYYSSPLRKVDRLSSDYYLGPSIDENKSSISNLVIYEDLNGVTESSEPIGYHMDFNYGEDDVLCSVTIGTYLTEMFEHESDSTYMYEGYEIIIKDIYFEEPRDSFQEGDLCCIVSFAYIGGFECHSHVALKTQDNDNYDRYKDISLKLMFELIDDYNRDCNSEDKGS